MAIPTIPVYTGGVANPDGSQDQQEFTTNMFNQLSYEASLAPALNNTVSEMNAVAGQVDTNAAIAQNSADAAQSAANLEGEFVAGVTSAEKGKSYSYNGEVWLCLQNTTTTPSQGSSEWKLSVGEQYVTTAQGDVLGGKLFRGSSGETVENGDVVEPGITHLRVLVDGKSTIVEMSPVANGEVSLLTESGATIGTTSVVFTRYSNTKITKVKSITTLSEYPVSDLDSSFFINEYNEGTSVGGGIWDTVLTSSVTPNGIDVVVSNYDPTYSFVISEKNPLLTPKHVGCVDAEDCGNNLQAFFDLMRTYKGPISISGEYKSSIKLDMYAPKTESCDAAMKITFTSDVGLYGLSFNRDGKVCSISGKIYVTCGERPIAYQDRKYDYGFYVINAARCLLPLIQVEGARIEGANFDSDRGNTTGAVIEKIRAFDNGYVDDVSFSNATNTGSLGSGSQGTDIDVSYFPSFYQRVAGAFVGFAEIDGEIYGINNVSGNTISLYPRTKLTDGASGTVKLYVGSGVGVWGSDSNVFNIGYMDTAGNAISFRDCGLYGQRVETLVSQFDGIGLAIGSSQTSSFVGGNIGRLYCEGNDVDFIKASRAVQAYNIEDAVISSFSKITAKPASITTTSEPILENLENVSIRKAGVDYYFEKNETTIKNGGYLELEVFSNNPSVTLVFDEDLYRLFNYKTWDIFILANRADNSFDGPLTITSADGLEINGSLSDLIIPGGAPVRVRCYYRNGEIYVNWVRYSNS